MVTKSKQTKSVVQSDVVPEAISKEDLKLLVDLRAKVTAASQKANTAALEAQNLDLQFQVILRDVYLKYGYSLEDNLNMDTGVVTRANKDG